jgi:hypothetical protein
MTTEEKQYRKITTNPPQSFVGYLKFSRLSIQILMSFAFFYLLLFICCIPMISTSSQNGGRSTMGDEELKRGASFEHIRGRKAFIAVKNELGTIKDRAIKWEEEAKTKLIEDVLSSSTVGRRDGEDAQKAGRLLDQAISEFELEAEEEFKHRMMVEKMNGRVGGLNHDHWEEALKSWEQGPPAAAAASDAAAANRAESNDEIYRGLHGDQKPGFMVLGMHRSGTSMLSGLLVKGFGYETGGPLISAGVSS